MKTAFEDSVERVIGEQPDFFAIFVEAQAFSMDEAIVIFRGAGASVPAATLLARCLGLGMMAICEKINPELRDVPAKSERN